MSDLNSKNGIPADGGNTRPLNFGGKAPSDNVRKGREIRYPAVPDAGSHELLDQQESGPRSPGRMPKRMSGGGT